MKKTYIFGHKKPDTDSVSAAIALSYLNNKLGIFSEARILDSPNFETKYALEYFNVPCPRYLNDVKPEIKDTDYTKDCYIDIDTCILSAYNILKEIHATAIPVVDKEINFLGIIRLKDIIKYYIFNQNNTLRTSYKNIILALNAKEILKFDEKIEATYYTENEIDNEIDKNCIIILSNKNLLDTVINKKPKMIILANEIELTEDTLIIYFHINLLTYNLKERSFHYYALPSGVNLATDFLPVIRNKSLDVGEWSYSMEKELDGYKSVSRINIVTGVEQTLMSCAGSKRAPVNMIIIPAVVSLLILFWGISRRKDRKHIWVYFKRRAICW